MAYEIRPNTGSLFKNDKKQPGDTHPDYNGSALIDGVGEMWLDAWINTSASGAKYMSLKMKPKNAPAAQPTRQLQAAPDDIDDDIGF